MTLIINYRISYYCTKIFSRIGLCFAEAFRSEKWMHLVDIIDLFTM